MAFFSNLRGVRELLGVLVRNQEKEQDSVVLVAGREGSGKSNLVLHCFDIMEQILGKRFGISYVTMSLGEFNNNWRNLGFGEPYALDEGDELDGEDWFMPEVRAFKRCLKKTRMMSNIYFISTTNPFKVNRYLKEDRLTAVFFVYDRGYIRVFDNKRFFKVYRDCRRKGYFSIDVLRYSKPVFSDTFVKYGGSLLKPYLDKKMLVSREAREVVVGEDKLPIFERSWLSLTQACGFLSVSTTKFYRFVYSGMFKKCKVGVRGMLFNRGELLVVRKSLEVKKKREKCV